MASIIDQLNSQLGPDGIQAIGRQLGLDPATTQKAIAGALPLLTGALAKNASRPEGAAALNRALEDHDGGVLDQLSGLLGGSGGAGVGSAGDAILGHILGGRRESAEAGLGGKLGLDTATIGKLLALLAPLVMGALGRARQQQGFGAGDLAGILFSERDQAQRQAPEGLGGLFGMLDLDGDGNPMDDISRIGGGLLGGLFGGEKGK